MIKKNNSIFVFIASIIVGTLISINFDFKPIVSYTQLDSLEYQKAVEVRNNLYKDIDNIRDDNLEMRTTLSKYKRKGEQNIKILEDMKNKISDYELFTGVNSVEGPGIILKINDGYTNYKEQDTDEINSRLLHDNDMAYVLNELRNAGAQAISVNNHRVVPWSGVICKWAFIGFDDYDMESAPFNIYVIGDPEKLKAAILEDGSYINNLIIRKLSVNIQTSNNIIIPASTSKGTIKFMQIDESVKENQLIFFEGNLIFIENIIKQGKENNSIKKVVIMSIKENIERIRQQIPSDVQLLAVSKTKPIEALEEVYKEGIRDFGENKVQELLKKEEVFHKDVRWHLIGHLQTNKVKYLVDKVHLIHSLDSIKLLHELEKVYKKNDRVVNTLIQINIGREETKSGILEEKLNELILEIEKCNNVLVKGIMVIIPKGDEGSNRIYFKRTKEIFENLKLKKFKNISMNILSMGMSNDYMVAISEGANLIRVGTKIFGDRNYNIGGQNNGKCIIKSQINIRI
eukprot:TRINITY_DN7764_c0_g1_i2.p1 TRINITY_DN7764_c0_g1~~TRINITY_DN7764_c0_g1_i2.p1  ORF type:complete len:515 (-),score=65.74 TRINITY_DN7764_c0_g1_i2:1501-3045(-)